VDLEVRTNQGRSREAGMCWRLTADVAGDILLSEMRMQHTTPDTLPELDSSITVHNATLLNHTRKV
jgi:hypothetical protein